MRPLRSTAVASTTIMPARLMAYCIRCWRCQSDALPSLAEYWHMGDTAMRLGTSIGPSLRGEKRFGTAKTLLDDEREAVAENIRPSVASQCVPRRLASRCRQIGAAYVALAP